MQRDDAETCIHTVTDVGNGLVPPAPGDWGRTMTKRGRQERKLQRNTKCVVRPGGSHRDETIASSAPGRQLTTR
jgi:hypothetical protein